MRDWGQEPRRSVCVRVRVLGSEDRFSLQDTTVPFQILHPESVFLKASILKSGCKIGRAFLRGPILG